MKEDQKIVIYKDENNSVQLEVRMDGEMIWLSRQQLAIFLRETTRLSASTLIMHSKKNWLMKW